MSNSFIHSFGAAADELGELSCLFFCTSTLMATQGARLWHPQRYWTRGRILHCNTAHTQQQGTLLCCHGCTACASCSHRQDTTARWPHR